MDKSIYKHKYQTLFTVLSIIVNLLIIYFIYYCIFHTPNILVNIMVYVFSIEKEYAFLIIKLGELIVVALLLLEGAKVAYQFLKEKLDAESFDIRVVANQHVDLQETCKEYCEKLGLDIMPSLYITSRCDNEDILDKVELFNPYAVRIPADALAICGSSNDYSCMKFIIARSLACQFLGYSNVILFFITLFSFVVPIISQANYKIMCYSIDQVARDLVGKDLAIKAIMEQASGYYASPYIDVKEYEKDNLKGRSFLVALENFFSNVPAIPYRIQSMLDYDENKGKLL